jgi:hypothetical protein
MPICWEKKILSGHLYASTLTAEPAVVNLLQGLQRTENNTTVSPLISCLLLTGGHHSGS